MSDKLNTTKHKFTPAGEAGSTPAARTSSRTTVCESWKQPGSKNASEIALAVSDGVTVVDAVSGLIKVALTAAPSTAWLRIEQGHAVICSWCEDAILAERRAFMAGLRVTHSVCPECAAKNIGTENSHGAPAEAAAASTPQAGAARAGYVLLHEVAAICGCDPFELTSKLRPDHWQLGRDFCELPGGAGFEIREASLPDLTGELAVSGRKQAAVALWRWTIQRCEARMALDDQRAGSAPVSSRPALAPAAPVSRLLQWEQEHQ